LTADESKRSDGCLLGAREPSEIDGVICWLDHCGNCLFSTSVKAVTVRICTKYPECIVFLLFDYELMDLTNEQKRMIAQEVLNG
jgi:hypothetical protein